ncbi:MAG: hypothetical protein J6Y72_04340 [Bacteroidales bacterium]|nr:hypothetical protein [Bacteroidales bacterium]
MKFFLSLSYKEWIKVRLYVAIAFAIALALLIYLYSDVALQVRMEGYPTLIYKYLIGSHILTAFDMLPIVAGIAVALSQFLPEMLNKRLKLTLHLPAPELNIISSMLLFGIAVYTVIMIFTYVGISVILSNFLPREYVHLELMTFVHWAIVGLTAYGFSTAVCIEPTMQYKISIALIGFATVVVSMWTEYIHATYIFPMVVVLAIASLLMSVYTTSRFKRGIM